MVLKLATVQTSICADVHANGRHIRATLLRAAQEGARLVHLPECALSGYVDFQVHDWDQVDWPALHAELQETAEYARRLGVWVVLGSNHRIPPAKGARRAARWPHNSLYVISDSGVIAGRYDKRLCSNTELTYWYTPGTDPLVFDVDGIRLGCALCIEVVFPHLFTEYERLGVDCLLLSSYSYDPIHGVMARAHAATNGFWVSMATPMVCSRGLPTTVFGPDGHILAECPADAPGMLVQTIDPAEDRYRVALRSARPWRARARSGELHASRAEPPAAAARARSNEVHAIRAEPPLAAIHAVRRTS